MNTYDKKEKEVISLEDAINTLDKVLANIQNNATFVGSDSEQDIIQVIYFLEKEKKQ